MKIETLLLCDSAQVANGKLFILGGGWTLYRAANYPTNIQIGLAVDVSFNRTEAGVKFPLKVSIADEAGIPIIPAMDGQIEAGQPAQEVPKGALLKLPLAINTALQLPRPGRYTIVMSVGSSKVQTSFEAIFVGTKVELAIPPEGEVERGH